MHDCDGDFAQWAGSIEASWIGFDTSMGWIVLDRQMRCNTNRDGDAVLCFLTLADLSALRLRKSQWNQMPFHLKLAEFRGKNVGSYSNRHEVQLEELLRNWLTHRTEIQCMLDPKDAANESVLGVSISQIRRRLCQQITSPVISQSPNLRNIDLDLCLAWSNLPVRSGVTAVQLLKDLGSWDACRLISARQAELVVCSYYAALGYSALDVSASQLAPGNDQRWKDFDIEAESLIDVKNARGSYQGSKHFLDHCVPRFKVDRRSKRDIRIFGVYSEYFKDVDKCIQGNSETKILGEVTIGYIENLKKWFALRFDGLIDLGGLWNEKYLPGWIYEFPFEHYTGQSEAVFLASQLLENFLPDIDNPKMCPAWIIVIAEKVPKDYWNSCNPRIQIVIQDLRALIECDGISVRSIYLYMMARVLELSNTEGAPRQFLDDLVELARFSNEGKYSWLGLADPCGYLDAMLEMTKTLSDNLFASGRKFTAFRLVHPYILKGIEDSGRQLSIVSYCGGWQTEPVKIKCGNAPLVIGRHNHCKSCFRLICDKCGFCFKNCPDCVVRQKMGKNSSVWVADEF